MNGFDSIQVRFKNTKNNPSPFANTRIVPFTGSYLKILKSIIDDVKTEYFWFFANFMNINTMDLDYIPEQHEKHQIHVWYNTHPLGGTNTEGNVFLIPTQAFKTQLDNLEYLRDYKDINYHPHNNLFQNWIPKTSFKLGNPYTAYNSDKPNYYKWLVNSTLDEKLIPNFFPSFWEDVKLYSWGKTKDIMLVPYVDNIKQFYDIERHVNYPLDYKVKDMDIIFLSYDEPNAEAQFKNLHSKFPRAKWCKGIGSRALAYITAAQMSNTDYFFFVTPKHEIVDTFNFTYQPDRLKNPCHYIFNARNPVNGLEYGHGAVLLYNKELVIKTVKPGLDFTLSAPHDHVPILSSINHFNQTAKMAWRTTFREVLKLLQMPPTVESKYRLKKLCSIGVGDHAESVLDGATDAMQYFNQNKDNITALKLSFELDWLNQYYHKKYS